MSHYPDATYAEATMATSGKKLVSASSGTPFGDYGRARHLTSRVVGALVIEATLLLAGTSHFPSATNAEGTMATSGKKVVCPSSGTCFGNYAKAYKILVDLVPAQTLSASDTLAPAMGETAACRLSVGISDALAPTAAESAAITAQQLGASETLAPTLAADALLRSSLADTLAPAISEGLLLSVDGVWQLAVSDTLVPAIAESVPVGGAPTGGVTISQEVLEAGYHRDASFDPPPVPLTQAALEIADNPANQVIFSAAVLEFEDYPPNDVLFAQVCLEVIYKGTFSVNHSFLGLPLGRSGSKRNASFGG